MKKALLLSASSYKDTGYLNHSKGWINDFLGSAKDDEILFIPYAGVRRNNEEYEQKVITCLENKNIKSIHRYDDKISAIKNAKTIAVGGGNTFVLMRYLYKLNLIDAIKQAVNDGCLYFGWSAGANIAGSSMMTTNDMPIIMPKSFDALNIFPYQINPHFISGKIQGHNGESREERLEEFLIVNQNSTVYAMPEGTGLLINDNEAEVIGYADLIKFEYKKENTFIKVGDKIKI
ncbi:(alpha)-aspartyl dipeptidase [Campylobacter pinnipediorum subsp. pinnipediorum]|uniref:Dipeptidase E n=1 Tax=Campylobacter pinnipediorum subsp. pinnipediorum TaxID=1660067 RepID=A0AAX0L9G4_9BACT|nr:dipeptidase PepE [Campylobacter pinnipediorum]AQW81173.1 (alpha)-aspartyl dipeptidase [Campylobacter pinnipediorum subsp. pinnipediorum]OPA77960.1 dipeptidase E [Campylobacter pinnipediorum subsp. pinnipediorum]